MIGGTSPQTLNFLYDRHTSDSGERIAVTDRLWEVVLTEPLVRVSLSDLAVDQLIRLIERRGLKEDDQLPATAELAEALKVSRTVVREAIAELAGQGLLRRQQGRETVITLPGAQQLERLLRLRFAVTGGELDSIQEYREVAEVGAARLAAERATPDSIALMKERLKEMRASSGEEELHEADQAFHREVARASDNDILLLTIDGITPLLQQLRRRAWAGWKYSGRGVGPIVEAHAAILERIEAKDSAGAAHAMAEHLAQAREGLHIRTVDGADSEH